MSILERARSEITSPECVAALAAASFVITPILGVKSIVLGPLIVLGGQISMIFAYGLIDVAHDVWGRAQAIRTIVVAAMARLFVWSMIGLVALSPGGAPSGWERVLHESFRYFLAGELAMLLSQLFVDVRVFAWVRERLRRGFWVRYNLSNLLSQTLTFALFVPLALAGTGRPLLAIFVSGILLRLLLSFIMTPIFAGLARWVKGKKV
jgi:uncharacterized integral membrane protein (TIGR00697 family)